MGKKPVGFIYQQQICKDFININLINSFSCYEYILCID